MYKFLDRIREFEIKSKKLRGNYFLDYLREINEFNEAQSRLSAKLKKFLVELFKDLNNVEELEAFNFHQYTPYFNDGDVCEFYVCHDYPSFEVKFYNDPEGFRWVDDLDCQMEYDEEGILTEDLIERTTKCLMKIEEVMRKIPDNLYLQAFGDHSLIEVSKEGISVSTYDHE